METKLRITSHNASLTVQAEAVVVDALAVQAIHQARDAALAALTERLERVRAAFENTPEYKKLLKVRAQLSELELVPENQRQGLLTTVGGPAEEEKERRVASALAEAEREADAACAAWERELQSFLAAGIARLAAAEAVREAGNARRQREFRRKSSLLPPGL